MGSQVPELREFRRYFYLPCRHACCRWHLHYRPVDLLAPSWRVGVWGRGRAADSRPSTTLPCWNCYC